MRIPVADSLFIPSSSIVVAKVSKAKLLTSKDVVTPPHESTTGYVAELDEAPEGRRGDTIDGWVPDSPAARAKGERSV